MGAGRERCTSSVIVSLRVDVTAGTIELEVEGEDFTRRFDVAEAPADSLRRQAGHFLDAIAGAAPRVSLRDGLAALAVADALVESAKNRSWIDVASIEGDLR